MAHVYFEISPTVINVNRLALCVPNTPEAQKDLDRLRERLTENDVFTNKPYSDNEKTSVLADVLKHIVEGS